MNVIYKRGMPVNGAVKIIQKYLKALGYYADAIDGDYGRLTEKAVKVFQRKHGLVIDGIVGVHTMTKLTRVFAAHTPAKKVKPKPKKKPAKKKGFSIVINPSSQYHNQGRIKTYIEARAMNKLAVAMKSEAAKHNITAHVIGGGYYNDLGDVCRRANAINARYFISVHSDSSRSENRMLILYVSPAGYRLAHKIGNHVHKDLGLSVAYAKRTDLMVLNKTNAPAALIEVLNHSSLHDVKLLLSNKYRIKCAAEIIDGIV